MACTWALISNSPAMPFQGSTLKTITNGGTNSTLEIIWATLVSAFVECSAKLEFFLKTVGSVVPSTLWFGCQIYTFDENQDWVTRNELKNCDPSSFSMVHCHVWKPWRKNFPSLQTKWEYFWCRLPPRDKKKKSVLCFHHVIDHLYSRV